MMDQYLYPLNLSAYEGKWLRDEENRCLALENVVTCAHALRPDLQCINLYIPFDCAADAPIVLRTCVGGYSEAVPEKLDDFGRECMEAGFVYVTAGARGKQTTDENGKFIGKSPIGLVDTKAAVRFLKHNAGKFPGDTEKIIFSGVSAGGAFSSLMAVTGNRAEYLPLLEEAGAAMDTGDDVFAAQVYCPIIDLEHADAAYEWMFDGVHTYQGFDGQLHTLDAFSQALSAELKKIYIEYFNSLGAKHPVTGEALLLGEDGRSGSAYEYLMQVVRKAAQEAGSAWIPEKLDDLYGEYMMRLKPCPSFDAIDYNNPETQVFGSETTDYLHFSPDVARAIDAVKDAFPRDYAQHYAAYARSKWDEKQALQRAVLNPFTFIGTEKKGDQPGHIRIRVGTKDPHTSFTMAMLLAVKLICAGHKDVDYAMVWDRDHCAADVPGGFAAWVRRIME